MGVDPWADENDEHETRGGVSSGEGVDELEREARRRREQVRATATPPRAPPDPSNNAFFPSVGTAAADDPPPLPRSLAVLQRGVPRGRRGREESHRAGGFNLGFREGATAGLAYGQARGAACSVSIFAGQVPGSSGWKASIAATTRMLEEMKPSAAAKSAREDFERVLDRGGGRE